MSTNLRPCSWRCRLILIALLGAAWTLPSAARDDCSEALRKAGEELEAGHLEHVETLLRDGRCLELGTALAEKARALALLAKLFVSLAEPDQAAAAVAELIRLDPGFRADETRDPGELVRMIAAEKAKGATVWVRSASKTREPLRETPATVVVITAEEIERRGYPDLEALFHDLPGFDVSRGGGDVFSSLYQRGYRSDRNDRTLLVIDGVEQNDLHSNTAYVSRQYPVSNVQQIEVIYGPASTIYGPNAFTGVISITTKGPDTLLAEGRPFTLAAQTGVGSHATRWLDLTAAGRTRSDTLKWSLNGRIFRSDEQNLSGFADWDNAHLASSRDLDYRRAMRLEGDFAREFFAAFPGLCAPSEERAGPQVCAPVIDSSGAVVALELTEAGEALARARDRVLFDALPASTLAFSDPTRAWFLSGKLQLADLTVGLLSWRSEEGTAPWYADLVRPGSGNVWVPRQTTIYAQYSRALGQSLSLSLLSHFSEHELADGTSVSRLATYSAGFLDFFDLDFGEQPALERYRLDQLSTQLRNELTVLYNPSEKLTLVTGIELRNNTIQADFTSALEDCTTGLGSDDDVTCQVYGGYFLTSGFSDKVSSQTLGVFSQLSYKPRKDFKLVLGGRLDTNTARDHQLVHVRENFFESDVVEAEGYGTVFNPRLALIYMPGRWTLKAIYAEAFQEPSSFQRFSGEPTFRESASPDLRPERVANLELAAGWQLGERLAIDLSAYQSDYSDVVIPVSHYDPCCIPSRTGRFENGGRWQIRGLQTGITWRHRRFELFGNYTYTEPFSLDPKDRFGRDVPGLDEVRIGDIASHRLNAGIDFAFRRRFHADLRLNWVGARKTGKNTTVTTNPLDEIPAYTVVHGTLSYQTPWPGASVQLVADNLFDETYADPGVQQAGAGYVASIPQPGRTLFLRLLYKR